MPSIPHSRPVFSQAFELAAKQVIQSGMLAQGDATIMLEHAIGQALGQEHVLAVDSGTSALMLAIRLLTQNKTQPRVAIPSFACASLLFAVKAAGAEPVFMDCNEQLCLDEAQAMTISQSVDVLLLVHPFGMVEPLVTASFACPVIEDIAQSVGADIKQQPVGSFGDICIGSLYATKPWGGAYGGFISSQKLQDVQTIAAMCNPDTASLNADYAGHHQLSNIHASLAQQRLKLAASERKQRHDWTRKYDTVLQSLAATPIHQAAEYQGNNFRYIIRCQQDAKSVIHHLQAYGIDAKLPIQQPLHRLDSSVICRHVDSAFQHCVSLPILADMSDTEFNLMEQGLEHCLTY